jgi:hypothetical protein
MTQAAQYELYHQRFGHPGHRTMSILHKHVDDVPILQGNAFYKCASCIQAKCKHRSIQHHPQQHTSMKWWDDNWKSPDVQTHTTLTNNNSEIEILPGQHFHMDFGFMNGSGFQNKDHEGRTITCIDGYRSYLLIIDKASRYTWVFLTKTKSPPITIIKNFLAQHGNNP